MELLEALELLRDEFAVRAASHDAGTLDAAKVAKDFTESLDRVIQEVKAGE